MRGDFKAGDVVDCNVYHTDFAGTDWEADYLEFPYGVPREVMVLDKRNEWENDYYVVDTETGCIFIAYLCYDGMMTSRFMNAYEHWS
jgi:hypothetical protein